MNEGFRRFIPDKHVDTRAEERRAELEEHIAEYLARGGEIEQLEMGYTQHRIQLKKTDSKQRRKYVDRSKGTRWTLDKAQGAEALARHRAQKREQTK